MDEKELVQKLQSALETELWVVTFYNDCINKVAEKKSRGVFVAMAIASAKHALLLMEEIDGIRLLHANTSPVPIEEEIRLATKGFEEEKEMKQTYAELAEKVPNKNLSKLFKSLVKQEQAHEKALSSLLADLQKKKK